MRPVRFEGRAGRTDRFCQQQDQRDLLFRVQPGTIIDLKLWPAGEGDLTIPAEWTVTRTRITKASAAGQAASVSRCGGAMCVQGLSGMTRYG